MKVTEYRSEKGAKSQVPKLIVIHSIGEFIKGENGLNEYAPNFLFRIGLSAHFCVSPIGEIIQMRKVTEGAYHAKGYNKDSIGIEVMVSGVHTYASFLKAIKTDYITQKALNSTALICSEIYKEFGCIQIVGHSEIDPYRKQDPGSGFDMQKLKEMLKC